MALYATPTLGSSWPQSDQRPSSWCPSKPFFPGWSPTHPVPTLPCASPHLLRRLWQGLAPRAATKVGQVSLQISVPQPTEDPN